jgi:hypothetical protein
VNPLGGSRVSPGVPPLTASRRRFGPDSWAAVLVGLLLLAVPGAAQAALPDGRAYELVSPAEKLGTDINGEPRFSQLLFMPIASSAGDAVAFTAFDALPGSASNGIVNAFRATRGANGWTTEALNSPMGPASFLNLSVVSALDLGLRSYVQAGPLGPPLTPDAAEGISNLYFHDGGGYRLITVGAPASDRGFVSEVLGRSDDLSHVVFTSSRRLGGEGPAGISPLLYDWSPASGRPTLVGRMPNGSIPASPVTLAQPPGIFVGAQHWNPVSANGSRIFFVVAPSAPDRQLFVRIDGSTTRQVSASKRVPVDPVGRRAANFRFAAADGSRAFFTSAEKLTNDATAGIGGGEDLYRYDVARDSLTDLTVDAADARGAEVLGVLGGARDGSRLYFVARGVLAPGGVAGGTNLYLWTDDGSAKGAITRVATGVSSSNWSSDSETFSSRLTSRVTPDGAHLLFESTASLTGYPNAGHFEAYLFEVGGGLTCVSCNPAGTPASVDAFAVGTGDTVALARTLSDDGRRVYFSSAERLVEADRNQVLDAYQYDAETDRLALISAGTGEHPSAFADATPSGSDVHFTTRDRLVGIDRDDSYDVYDARVGGGIAAQNPPPVAECAGALCRDPFGPVPPALLPGSLVPRASPSPKPHRKRKAHRKRRHGGRVIPREVRP